jgi:hypothetical protein
LYSSCAILAGRKSALLEISVLSAFSFYGGIARFAHPIGFNVRAIAVVKDQLQGLIGLGIRIHVEVLDSNHIPTRSEDYRLIMIPPLFAGLSFIP